MGNWKKNTVLFLTSQTISLFGSSLVQYAITWYIALETRSGVMMTLSIICGFLPNLLLAPFAGVWADRYNRKVLIAAADGIIALSTLVMAVLFLTGHGSVWILIGVSAIRSFGTSIQTPAVSAFLPQIVPVEKLTKVNAANQTIQSFTMLLSPILSGALLTVSTIESIFFIDVVTAGIAIAFLLLFLRVPAHTRALEKIETSYFADMRDGVSYIRRHTFVMQFMIFYAISSFLASPVMFLTTLQVPRSFGPEVWRLTVMEITFSIGMMLGGLILAAWGGFKNRFHSYLVSNLVTSALTVALGLAPGYWFYISVFGVIGLFLPLGNTPVMVVLQEKIEDEFRGRVFSVLSMIASSVMPLSMIIFGPLADVIAIEWILVATGIGMVILTLVMIGNKALQEAGKPLPVGDVPPSA